MIVRELVFWLVFCIAIGIFTVFIVSIISILLVIAELVLMMFPDLRVPWTSANLVNLIFSSQNKSDLYYNGIQLMKKAG